MSELDDARARVAHLEAQAGLEQDLAGASAAVAADPSPENWAAQDAAAVALTGHRAKPRTSGMTVTGDVTVTPDPAEGS